MIVCGAIRLFFSFVSSQIMGSSVTVAVDTIASWFITVFQKKYDLLKRILRFLQYCETVG